MIFQEPMQSLNPTQTIGKQMTTIVVVTSEKFTLDFVNSLRKNKAIEFAQQYRSADVLLIDDIQFMNGKEAMQEEFFHTFNALLDKGSQIIVYYNGSR